jgi:hypothetical protein
VPRSPAVPVEWMNRREQQTSDNRGKHGFA